MRVLAVEHREYRNRETTDLTLWSIRSGGKAVQLGDVKYTVIIIR
jgi:hypothetical protein